jgi:hypothetical protein
MLTIGTQTSMISTSQKVRNFGVEYQAPTQIIKGKKKKKKPPRYGL